MATVRQTLPVLVALVLAAWPVYFLWALAVRRDFSPEGVGTLIGMGVFCLLVLLPIVGLLLRSEHPRWYAGAVILPFVSLYVLLIWLRHAAAEWRPKADRAAERERRLAGLDDFAREVFRLRFDTVEDHFDSRRKAARKLHTSIDQVVEAERRIWAHLEEKP